MWNAYQVGASFEKICTFGQQSLFLHPAEVNYFRNLNRSLGFDDASLFWRNYQFQGSYVNDFFVKYFESKLISVIDYSSYQGADIIHDLNTPISDEFDNRYDVVIDGGTLEHIFNFPIAISNMMRMVRVGGRVFLSTPANNQCGHGMYQFSPELMFRVFSPENGFEVINLQLIEGFFPSVELGRNRKVYKVRDPKDLRSRVGFINHHPVTMMVEARKLASVNMFVKAPLQSDYVTAWDNQNYKNDSKLFFRDSLKRIIKRLPVAISRRLRGYYDLNRWSLSNHEFFNRI